MSKKINIGVVVFPGSNCDMDTAYSFHSFSNVEVKMIWHQENNLKGMDAVILPGGFSYGDYLRSGAIASRSPIMNSVISYANQGRPVLGICNGFQILLESGILQGALIKNKNQRFICKPVTLRVERNDTIYASEYQIGQVLTIPIAHADGNFFATDEILQDIEEHDLVAFRYCSSAGLLTNETNPNGSMNNIAGIYNKQKNVLGLMPHPDRSSESILGMTDGKPLFSSLVHSIQKQFVEALS